MNETPLLRQLLICEKLVFEKGTDHVSLINCHTICGSDRFPTRPIQFGIYGLLTNGFGTFTMELTVVHLLTGAVIYRRLFSMSFADRLRDENFAGQFKNGLVFPDAGVYQIDLLANGELLGMTTLEIEKR
jgi:hypothetical protein